MSAPLFFGLGRTDLDGDESIYDGVVERMVAGGPWLTPTAVDVKIYPGAGHAFANVNNPWKGYREDAAKDAWKRSVDFLARHLKRG